MANDSQSRAARRKQQSKSKKKNKSVFKKVILIIGIVFLASVIGIGGLFTFYIATAPDLDGALLSDPASSKIYDMDEELYADLGTEKRTKTSYTDLPETLIDAVLATEDVRFFEHSGIDLRRIGAAVLANVTDGFGSEGASTITQQVVKDSFLSTDKTIKRKVQEQWIAIQLDREYSKEEILEMYLNKIYYGSGAYGVATAAKTYFSKTDLSELTLAESAILAGLPQRPSAYDPTVNPDLTQERMETVLNLMVRHGKITEEEAEEAKAVNVEDVLNVSVEQETPYQAFIQKVADEVEEKTGSDIYTDGLEVYTTLDPVAQEEVELVLSNSDENPIDFIEEELQSGIVVTATNTGAIRAIGGGRNRENNNGWNYAYQGDGRQAGSAIKPILDYGPAIENLNWSTYQQINDDAPYEIGNEAGDTINNWNNKFQGWMSIRYALQWSLNIPAVKTLDEVGTSQAADFANGLGFNYDETNLGITEAIGGAESDVTPLVMAGAYSAFGNEGIYNEPYAVTKVVYDDGSSEDLKSEPVAAMSDSTAYMITDMLKSVVQSGTGTVANVSSIPMAGKTGTTDNDADIWFAGYSTNYTVSVWSGYPEGNTRPVQDTKISQKLFNHVMSTISAGVSTPDFEKPSSVVEVKVEKGSNPAKLASAYTPSSQIVTELFKKGHEPEATSEKFEQLDPVSSLSASYDEDANLIDVSWDYNGDEDVTFQVSTGSNSTTTDNNELEISNIERGTSYTIEVIAISKDDESNVSEARTVEVAVPAEEIEEEEPEEEVEEEPVEPDPEETEESEEPAEPEKPKENDDDQENPDSDKPKDEEETPETPKDPDNPVPTPPEEDETEE
ncbi:transglycosylase domain-containing protein [Paraliobacillus sediminis]|uniref:transglycosylase domain-containing protein n=1 Tax=Paraliobacillus sediminis TaxID=1885916 RepID=UPI000E3DDB6F|nr:PBP1A family penicillin-binding protein [Paraliobacillus sediminis]